MRMGRSMLVLLLIGCGGSRKQKTGGPDVIPDLAPTVDASAAVAPDPADAAVPAAVRAAVSKGAPALTLTYQGEPFQGSSLLWMALRRSDGTEVPVQLRPEMYSAFQDCTRCPAKGPIVEHSPMAGGPPPQTYSAGPLARLEGDRFGHDEVAECAGGGRCIRRESFAPGEYTVRVGNKLICPGSFTVPLTGEVAITCTR